MAKGALRPVLAAARHAMREQISSPCNAENKYVIHKIKCTLPHADDAAPQNRPACRLGRGGEKKSSSESLICDLSLVRGISRPDSHATSREQPTLGSPDIPRPVDGRRSKAAAAAVTAGCKAANPRHLLAHLLPHPTLESSKTWCKNNRLLTGTQAQSGSSPKLPPG